MLWSNSMSSGFQRVGNIPSQKGGTSEYASARELMGEKSDAVELKPNQTVTGKSRESSKSRTPKKTDSEEKIHKAVQTLVPTGDKPLWVDEPKPVEKKAKKQKPDAPEVADVAAEARGQKKSKNKKKSVATQPEAPSSPKSEDFIVKLK